jgi:hypothetical protein
MPTPQGFCDLKVYQLPYQLARMLGRMILNPEDSVSSLKFSCLLPSLLYISCRFVSALSIVTSSTYSRSLPTGMPIASRVTRRPRGFSKRLM